MQNHTCFDSVIRTVENEYIYMLYWEHLPWPCTMHLHLYFICIYGWISWAPPGPRGGRNPFTLCLGIAPSPPTLKKVSWSQPERYKFVTEPNTYGGSAEKLAWAPRVRWEWHCKPPSLTKNEQPSSLTNPWKMMRLNCEMCRTQYRLTATAHMSGPVIIHEWTCDFCHLSNMASQGQLWWTCWPCKGTGRVAMGPRGS